MAASALQVDGQPSGAWMPHLALSAHDLDERFPTLVVPDKEELDDGMNDMSDDAEVHDFTDQQRTMHSSVFNYSLIDSTYT